MKGDSDSWLSSFTDGGAVSLVGTGWRGTGCDGKSGSSIWDLLKGETLVRHQVGMARVGICLI